MSKYKIKEVAQQLGIHAHKIRIWSYNNLINLERQTGKDRLFSKKDITRLEKIKFILENGFNVFSLKIALRFASLDKIIKEINKEKDNV